MQTMLRYSLRQLSYLVACIDEGSLVAAAARLHVSQPSISAAITKLETDLGVQLLVRHHAQGVTPTASARRLVRSARSLLAHAEDLERQARVAGGAVAGELSIASFVTLAPVYLPGLLAEIGTAYPDLDLHLAEGTQDQLVEGLRTARFECALLYDLDLPADLRLAPLAEVAPYVLLPRGHPLAAQADVALSDLAAEPLVLLDVAPSRRYFTGLLAAAGVEPRIAFSSPSLEMVRGLVGRGLGCSLLVTRPVGDTTYDGQPLEIRPVRGPVEPSRIAIATLTAVRPTRAMQAFEELAVAHFRARFDDRAVSTRGEGDVSSP
jgi:DNA-binding transcriptional LysR family regulator